MISMFIEYVFLDEVSSFEYFLAEFTLISATFCLYFDFLFCVGIFCFLEFFVQFWRYKGLWTILKSFFTVFHIPLFLKLSLYPLLLSLFFLTQHLLIPDHLRPTLTRQYPLVIVLLSRVKTK